MSFRIWVWILGWCAQGDAESATKATLSEKLSYDVAWRAAPRKNGAAFARFQERDGDAACWKAPFCYSTLGLINRKHAECRKSERASERASQAVSTLQPAEQMGERCDGVRIVVVAVIDYREIIKRSRPRRAKKSHLTARGQRDTVGTTVCPVKTCKAASLSGRNIPWRNK